MASLRVIGFRESNLASLLRIERACFGRDAYSPGLFREWRATPGSVFLIARVGRVMAGYVLGVASAGAGEVVSIAVAPPFRRAGVGRALMNALLEKLSGAGAGRAELMVRLENDSAIRFYRGLGFRRVRRVAGYYEDGGGGWLMRKAL